MEPSINQRGHFHFGYGGDVRPEHVVSEPSTRTDRKKSKVRLNDQLVPKPTDINMAENVIKTAAPREHPHASHICRFAMFPSFNSPDDPDTGVRAASQPFPSRLIPTAAPDVTVLGKTKGGPYRHEAVQTPLRTRKKAVMWTGEHGFLDHAKTVRGERQVMYPTPPKTVLPNPKLRDWDLSLSERTCNMLKNLERSLWVTSYQMDYTGSGPANPLKIDDFNDKMNGLPGMTSNASPLRERSYPMFVPSKPRQEWRRRRQGSHMSRSTAAAGLLNPCPAPNRDTAPATTNHHRSQEITAEHNEAPDSNKVGHSQSECSSGSTEAGRAERSLELFGKKQDTSKSPVYQCRETENCKVRFDESLMHVSTSQNSREANAADTKQPMDLKNFPRQKKVDKEKSSIELRNEPNYRDKYFTIERNPSRFSQPGASQYEAGIESHAELETSEQQKLLEGRELRCGVSNRCVLPRPPVLPGLRSEERAESVGGDGAVLRLRDLQDTFTKSEAHHRFHSSITRAAVDLRDNVVTGKKHDFYGINCNYLHG